MKGPLKESDKSFLLRWACEHTYEQLQGRIKLYREEAMRMQYDVRFQAKLIAASNFLRYDKSIRQMWESEPEDIWVGEDWA